MSPPPVLALRDISVSFGGKPLFENLDMKIVPGERICLVGRNGSGKSTLLKVLAGQVDIDKGEIFVQPGIKVSYLPQDLDLPAKGKILDYIVQETGHPEHEIEAALGHAGMDPERDMEGLSGGERRRVLLAKTLVESPDVLLLDEPTNHLDIPAIEWLEETLKAFRGAFIVISHDRKFLEKVSNTTLWLDRGKLLENNKGYGDFERWQEALLLEEERQLEKITAKLRLEEDWLHRGVTARRKRNQGRLRQLKVMRMERRSRETNKPKSLNLGSLDAELGSKMIIEAFGISKSYGERTLIKDFSTRIIRGDRLGIVGPNGSGKTTLVKMLVKQLAPDEGRCRMGKTVELIYFDQMRDTLKPDETLWQNLCPTGGDTVVVQGRPRHVVAYLKDFLFQEKNARAPVSILSGGEKNRLALAKALTQPGNLLVLDEPTNDLDMDTLDLLQEMLSEFEGTLIIVSHDRDFLDKLTTSVIAVEGDGTVQEYVGGYSDYLEEKAKRGPKTVKTDKSSAKSVAPSQESRPKAERKYSYMEKRDYDLLPGQMKALEEEIRLIEEKLDDPDFYTHHHQEFTSLSNRLEQAKAELESAELRWLELAEKIEG